MEGLIKRFEAESKASRKSLRRVDLPFEIWSSDRCGELLLNKTIVFLGDSNARSSYVDLITHLQQDHLSNIDDFKNPTHDCKANDKQIAVHEKASNGADFFQVRSYYHEKTNTRVLYYFVTRVFSSIMCEIFEADLQHVQVDIVIANSTFYDIAPHHYGDNCMKEFERNVKRFFDLVTKQKKFQILWRGTLPLGEEAHGGFMSGKITVTDGKGDSKKLRRDVLDANKLVRRFCWEHDYPFLDCHAFFEYFCEEQQPDGIHWTPYAHRALTCLTLTHVRRIWGLPPLPWSLDATIIDNPVTKTALENYISEKEYVVDVGGWPVQCSISLENVKVETDEVKNIDKKNSEILKKTIYPDKPIVV